MRTRDVMSDSPPTPTLFTAAVAAMKKNGFDPEFSPAVMEEVRTLDDPSDNPLPSGTIDLRSLDWSSVDNRESLDLDQIEVAERLADSSIRIRIGVADVDSLVKLGSAADDHASMNTTSVYTGVAVFPMLPERLSTDLTSLNENEDRLAVIVQFDVAADGALGNQSVYRALVRNKAKLTYEGVGHWLDGKAEAPRAVAASPALEQQMRLQDEAAQRLRHARSIAGALDFESIEARPVVVNGKVVDLAVARRNRARDLIEDFMVAANRSVAVFLLDHGSPSLRRVVREPKRWDRIVALAAELGETLPEKPDNVALSQFLAKRRAADPEHFVDLSLSVVKLLGPGIYVLERRLGSRRQDGHFGLAVADYVHSTAPNRRFADLVTQRMIRAVSEGGSAPYSDAELTEIAARCTERGEAARKVERTMRKVAGASMLAERVGESFAAIVTASSDKGVYARVLSPPVEGRIVRGGRGLDVGDTVRLKLVVADPERGYIDFAHGAEGATARKLERSRRKKIAADRMRAHIGENFEAEVTGVSESGTYVRLVDGSAEGRVVRGYKPLTVGMKVSVKLVNTDSVHGFIDFEYTSGVDPSKEERLARKRAAALALRDRIGETFRAVVTGTSKKATWLKIVPDEIEARLVRGRKGLSVGDETGVILLSVDPGRGFIDFAREDTVLPSVTRKP
ncbi:MAG TPA: RNB domain-containing ribonuclease [Gemmatimonadaceae bacterium]|nr:RNB domain-containing ribonuclease [Gemmatimonadaceae bacterium]